MRKWIAGLLALTALSPAMASAQEVPNGPTRGGREAGWRDGVRTQPRADVDDERPGGDRRGGSDAPSPRQERGDRPAPERAPPAYRDGSGSYRGGPAQGTNRPDPRPSGDDSGSDWRRPNEPGRAGWRQPRGGDRPGWQQRRDDRPNAGDWRSSPIRPDRPSPDRSAADRRRDDWTRSRLDRRDDSWMRSRFDDRAAWNRGWRSDDRYDWNRYRALNRDAFRLPRYYAPGGFGGYRRTAIGVGLQASFRDQRYWIDDPFAYRLPEAYGPYRWVRYYDDALLIDLRSGIVVDAAYGIFW